MDDFFSLLLLEQDDRLNEPAGNIHYERFYDEVIAGINNNSIVYKKFDCSTMSYSDTVSVNSNKVLIIEGSYSFSHNFYSSYDYRVFLNCDKETQLNRINNRVGSDRLQQFIDKWIPLEEKYFEHYNPSKYADIILDTSKY